MLEYVIKYAQKVEAHILHLQKQVNEFSLRKYSYDEICNADQKHCQDCGVASIDTDLQDIVKYLDMRKEDEGK